jgi:ABC-2 type transport system permease protein
MMAVIQNSYSNVVSSFFSHKFQRSIEELLVSPVPNFIILAGFVVGGMVRGLAVGGVVTIIASLFINVDVQHPILTIAVVLLTSIVFSLAGFINAIFANTFDDISIIPTFVLTPLIYLGGVFYSVSLLPAFWSSLSYFNPIFYMVNTFRYGFLGVSDTSVSGAIAMLGLFICGLTFICLSLLRRGKGLRA